MLYHQRQQSNPSLRELLNQLVNTLKHPFDSPKHTSAICCQSKEAETANARLSQFEKTYVSFPEFVDISTNNESRTPLYNSNDQSQQPWHQQSLASY
jgi:hypothetical protein